MSHPSEESGPWTLYGHWRRNTKSGEEFLDLGTLGFTREGADTCRTKDDYRHGRWAKANPAVRCARFELREVKR